MCQLGLFLLAHASHKEEDHAISSMVKICSYITHLLPHWLQIHVRVSSIPHLIATDI